MIRIKRLNSPKIHLNWLTFFQYAFILCMILEFRSVWMHMDSSLVGKTIKLLMGVIGGGGILARRKISSRRMLECVAVAACLIAYWAIWFLADSLKSGHMITILIQALLLVVYCMLVEDSVDESMRKYSNIVFVIAAVSLVFWVFGSLLGWIHSTGTLYTTWTGNEELKAVPSYYGIYFETQTSSFFGLASHMIVRNTAIFTEAPMASFVFSLAFMYEMLMREKLNWKRCMLFAVAIISTSSTSGATALVLVVGLKYVFTKSKTKVGLSLKLFLLPMVVVAVLIALGLLLERKLGSSSGSIRMDDFSAGYKAWMDAPSFGNGLGNSDAIKRHMASFRVKNTGLSNSPMQVLAYGGIYLFLPYYVAAIKGLITLIARRQWNRMTFYLVFLYLFTITICSFQMLTFYLFMSLASETGKRRVQSMALPSRFEAEEGAQHELEANT